MTWTAISKSEHSKMMIRRAETLAFLSTDILVPICGFELALCTPWLPIVFGKENNKIMPFGLMGLEHGKNLMIDANGKWTIEFFPATLAAYPFRIGKKEDDEKIIIFFDDGKFIAANNGGERLFNEDGTESKILSQYIQLLARIEKSNELLGGACSLLEELNLFEIFAVEVPLENEQKSKLEGLLRVDPQKFQALEDKQIINLREKNALDLVYAHFFSLGGIRRLNQIRKKKRTGLVNLEQLGDEIFGADEENLDLNLS